MGTRVRTGDDKGQVLPLVAVLMGGAAALALLVAFTGAVVADRARAATAADAAALAGAAEGRTGADELARANGGRIEHFAQVDGDTIVVVRVGRAQARARARAEGATRPEDPVHSPTVPRSPQP